MLLSIREAETLDDMYRIYIEIQLSRGWLHSRWEPVALVSYVRVRSWPSRQLGRKDGCEVGDARTDWNLWRRAGIYEDRWTHVAFSLLPSFPFPGSGQPTEQPGTFLQQLNTHQLQRDLAPCTYLPSTEIWLLFPFCLPAVRWDVSYSPGSRDGNSGNHSSSLGNLAH